MKLFSRRKKVNSDLPPEIQAYAQAEHRERMGMAWLVGLVSLIVTVLILVGLYFGGQWVYRKIAHKDQPTDTAQIDKKAAQKQKDDKAKEEKKQTGATDTRDADNNSTNTPVQAPTPPVAPATQPATGDNGAETLVRTGPDIDL